MRNKREKIIAVSISVLLHTVLLTGMLSYKLPGISAQKRKKIKLFGIKIAKDARMAPASERQQVQPRRKLEFISPVESQSIKKFLGDEETSTPKEVGFPDEQAAQIQAANMPPEILEARDQPIERASFEPKEQRPVQVSLREGIELVGQDMVDQAGDRVLAEQVGADFEERMPGFTPVLIKDKMSLSGTQESDAPALPFQAVPVITKMEPRAEFQSDLEWVMQTYQDPQDQQKYFRITLRSTHEAEQLPTLAKEIVFLIDCSISVDEKRLREFKEGVRYSLQHLNKGDVFNVIAFKKRVIYFSPESVEATEENREKAFRFIEDLRSGEKTDMYEALLESLERKASRQASYLILLSDGYPTHGVTNPLEVITKISRINNGRVPVFAFSGGVSVNRYLLDFISYTNRGWTEYARRPYQISEKLSSMYDKIDKPAILNLRYFINGVQDDETFPKRLPDFFHGTEFTLYGRYGDQDQFVVQLLGDVEGETREFVMQGQFSEGVPAEKAIAQDWAYNKIFYLISKLQYDKNNQDLLDQIKTISEKFKIRTPYLQYIP